MLKLWQFFNGKKTAIGAAFLFAAVVIQGLASIWAGDAPPDWLPKAIETLEFIGGIITGTGFAHKTSKAIFKDR